MIKPCMQHFDKALTYEHVNVRDYNLVHACNSHMYTWTQKHTRHPNACMSEHTTEHTPFLSCPSVFRGAVSLARLVKAEIVSPYHRILINMGLGNTTTPSIVALGKQAIPNGQVGRCTAFSASIKG